MKNVKIVEEIMKGVRQELGREYTVCAEEVSKNNDQIRTGLRIQNKGDSVGPILYIDKYIEDICNHEAETKGVVDEIVESYTSLVKNMGIDIDELKEMIENFSSIKGRIVYQLVNTKMNQNGLLKLPHRNVLDLSVTYAITVDENSSIKITNEHIKMWNVNEFDLWDAARANINPNKYNFTTEFICPLHVLADKKGVYGAALILADGCVERFADEVDSDLWLLPSSIHEWIAVPASEYFDWESLEQMIQDINRTNVDPTEVLSDHPYFYERKTGVLRDKLGNAFKL